LNDKIKYHQVLAADRSKSQPVILKKIESTTEVEGDVHHPSYVALHLFKK
jgi:hypothetical protein